MTSNVAARLAELGIVLPAPSLPAANYRATILQGDILYVARQLPLLENQPAFSGRVPDQVDPVTAYAAARLCAINIIAQASAALGDDLDRVAQVLRVGGFVWSSADFAGHAKVIDGASDLLGAVFGTRGHHVRVSVGAVSLPRGAPVEVEASFQVRRARRPG